LRDKYPSLKIIEVDDIHEGLDKVKSGELFAYIDTLASIGYEFQSNYFGELKIAGKISESLKLSVAVRKDDPILLNLLQKAINNISNERHNEIFTRWIPVKYEQGLDYTLIWELIVFGGGFLGLILYWNRKIIRANALLKQAQKDIEEKNQELNRLAWTGNLTGLLNRRKLEEIIQTEVDKISGINHSFCLSILDVDHFKDINDNYGHQKGDSVLVKIANILMKSVAEKGYVGRFGGEEFIIIFPESNIDEVKALIEELRMEIAHYKFDGIEHKTVSFGLTVSQESDAIETVIKRADKALYEAKENGRNRVVVK